MEPSFAAISFTKLYASSTFLTDFCRSMMYIPLRSVKIYFFIFGSQRRVWSPKCTRSSNNCFIEIIDILFPPNWFFPPFASFLDQDLFTCSPFKLLADGDCLNLPPLI